MTEHHDYADGTILYRLSALEHTVGKHEKDLYHGNGKPGITTRVAMTEETLGKISKHLGRLVWLGVGTLMTVVGFVIEQNILHGPR